MNQTPPAAPRPLTRPSNGDSDGFYVEPDCCMLCGVPEATAPEVFETGDEHCAVKRQPGSPGEIDRTLKAMWSAEVDCIRYGGRDPQLLERIAQAGMADQADIAPTATAVVLRNRVRFALPDAATCASALAGALRADARAGGDDVLPAWLGRTTVWVSWFEKRFHRVRFSQTAAGFTADLRSLSALQGLSWWVDDWLRAQGATDIRWEKAGEAASERPTPM